jgi:tRNA1Val (adenine37-N6)-methyltransferase
MNSIRDLTDDALTDRVRVAQRRGGHRYSFDDVVTAWVAVRAAPSARTYLDLGCGLGSVLLMVADRLPQVRAAGIEAQVESFELAKHNVERSWLAPRVWLGHGDLRDARLRERAREAVALHGFDLVTGTPPYKKPGTATPSPDPQRAHARLELRGGVEDYLAAAATVLAPTGTCVVCMESESLDRVEAGARAAGLVIRERVDVIPIEGKKGRLFSVITLKRIGDPPLKVAKLVLRDALGARTPAALELRRFFGLKDPVDEPPSPPSRSAAAVAKQPSDRESVADERSV